MEVDMSLSQSIEDYLETIYLIKNRKGYVRIKDIVEKLKIAPP
ncbi:MAG TPA: metal-dependent transcriptional regulator, partial [Bacteroidetes bacterium]|nr:metal-dependent transcriptional regulator [Bacteroidota bacterium]